jgi:hypothetical protein
MRVDPGDPRIVKLGGLVGLDAEEYFDREAVGA